MKSPPGEVREPKPSDYAAGYDGMTKAWMLTRMKMGWKSDETPCGRGSELEHTRLVSALLPQLMLDYKLTILADAGAGDCHWIKEVAWVSGVLYKGYDLVPRHKLVKQFDLTTEVLPRADLILCRHVLNHLSVQYALDAIQRFRESGSTYLLMTNCVNQQVYWHKHDVKVHKPIATWKDATKWWLELHDLSKPIFYGRP